MPCPQNHKVEKQKYTNKTTITIKKTLLLLVTLITATIAFASVEIDGIYYNLNNKTKTAEVTYQYYWDESNYFRVRSITIPEKITCNATEYSITSIGYEAFSYCSFKSITIPNSVTSIGDSAFHFCSSLTSITIPNSINYIGKQAFGDCSYLNTITCLGTTPPEASDLGAQYETATLFVPKGSLNNYKNHAEWGKFQIFKSNRKIVI